MNASALHSTPRYIRFDEVESTNTVAKDPCYTPVNDIVVIVAARQRAGRGRFERSFYSSIEGGLWVSLVVPVDDVANHFSLNRSLSCAIAEALAGAAPNAAIAIKWPNDIYCNGKKICGILLESVPHNPNALIAGFGLNVNIAIAQFPAPLQTIATSLLAQTGKEFDLNALLTRIIELFYDYWRSDNDQVHRRYGARLYRLGDTIRAGDNTGIFEGVTLDGALCLRTDAGVRYIRSGEVTFL
jgi:BirA family transcriptional regulator, biotin operon repressor / biotin---[acetyl-CoA-carboxylase] ligase